MKNNRSFAFRAAAFAAALLYLTACGTGIEYPEGADTLPTYSATGTVMTIYDTSEHTTPEMTTAPETTTTETTTSVTESETETETVPSESETSLSTTASLSLEDVPEVGISEYYEKTQTTPPTAVLTAAETSASSVSTVTSAVTSASESAVTVSTAGTAAESEASVTAALSANASDGLNIKLTDGRKSPYTGRDIISHPYSYYTLDNTHKVLYDKLVSAMLSCEKKVTFTADEKVTFQQLFDTYQLIYNDENRLFYISPTINYSTDPSTGYIKAMDVSYIFDIDKIPSMQAEVDKAADNILSMITPEMNDYDIVKLFHDYIIRNCTYDEKSANQTRYTAHLLKSRHFVRDMHRALHIFARWQELIPLSCWVWRMSRICGISLKWTMTIITLTLPGTTPTVQNLPTR